ncbi:MAG: two-component regulator propeller domain-containing protein [Flavobacteriales bacterium]|jgi:ligand-binding sensor domain-containing protein
MKSLFITICLILFHVAGLAQQPYFSKLNINYQSSGIRYQKIYEDSTGIIWIGTNEGIIRFNGKTSKLIRLPLQNNQAITALTGDGEYIYAGSEKGLLYRIKTQPHYTVEHFSYNENAITALLALDNETLWAGTASSGIAIFKGANLISTIDQGNVLQDNSIHFLIHSENKIYVGTDAGLHLISTDKKLISVITNNEGLSDNLVHSIYKDGDKMLLGTYGGTLTQFYINNPKESTVLSAANEPIRFVLKKNDEWILITGDNQILIATHDLKSIYESNYKDNEAIDQQQSISDAIIDREGNLIMCQNNGSILISNLQFLYTQDHESVSFKNITSIYHDRSGKLWLATSQGLCYHADEFIPGNKLKFITKQTSDPKHQIICIREDQLGRIWFGKYGAGLGVFDPTTNRIDYINNSHGLEDGNIFSIAEVNNQMWLATLNGIYKAEYDQKKINLEPLQIANDYSRFIYQLFYDSKGRVWLGTDGKGVAYIQKDKLYPVLNESMSIIDITEDDKGNIWFLTSENEIIIWNESIIKKEKLKVQRGFAHILSIEADRKGSVTALATEGIFSLTLNQNQITFFPAINGINSNYLDIITNDENFQWFALENALVRYERKGIAERTMPLPLIDHVLVSLQPIDTSIHVFNSTDRHFTFNVSGLWLKQQDDLVFRYRLLGLDSTWVHTRDADIIFPRLSYGDYTFELQVAVHENWLEATTASYSFSIKKPFWQQWWFILISSIALIAAIFYTINYRIKAREKKMRLQQEQTQVQLDTLRNQINPHFLFNSFNALINAIHQDKESAIDYVEKLSDYYRQILENQNKQIITLEEEIALVENYLYLQKQRFGNNLKCEVSIDSNFWNSVIPPMTLQLLAENAVKHNSISQSTPLKIAIIIQDGGLIVKNTKSPKISPEKSTGVGLNNIRSRYQLLFQKSITVEDTHNFFVVTLPLIINDKQ